MIDQNNNFGLSLSLNLWRIFWIIQHEDQRSVYGWKAFFKLRKKRQIIQLHCTSTGHSQNNNVECTKKERITGAFFKKIFNRLAREKNIPKITVHIVQQFQQQPPQGTNVGIKATVERRLQEQKYRGCTTKCKPFFKSKILTGQIVIKQWVTNVLELRLTKMMERPNCGERTDLLITKQTKLVDQAQAYF